jgi:hypothetical protein
MADEQVLKEQDALRDLPRSATLDLQIVLARARALARTKYEAHAWTFRF